MSTISTTLIWVLTTQRFAGMRACLHACLVACCMVCTAGLAATACSGGDHATADAGGETDAAHSTDASPLGDGEAGDGGCGPGEVDTDGGCLGAPGAPCAAPEECATGHCADERCCDGPCDEPCQRCGADGQCGASPDGPDAVCPTHCLDGVCQPCPEDMAPVEGFCMDRFEAPNREGKLPLVMYTFVEAEAWCAHRQKRLCFDDEWTRACDGGLGWSYPYGATHQPGVCNDDETWRTYNQTLLNGWPPSASLAAVTSLEELLDGARLVSSQAAASADHVEWLYQGEPSGANLGCTFGAEGIFDLTGNVEEWTRRRDGGTTSFHGNLKGRYWAETRTCQSNILSHGDGFRFYEIGFRCCSDLLWP